MEAQFSNNKGNQTIYKEADNILKEHRITIHENPAGFLEIPREQLITMLSQAYEKGLNNE